MGFYNVSFSKQVLLFHVNRLTEMLIQFSGKYKKYMTEMPPDNIFLYACYGQHTGWKRQQMVFYFFIQKKGFEYA